MVALAHNGLNRRERGLHLLIQLIAKDMHPFTVAFHLANVPDFESRPEDLEGVIMDWACHAACTQAPLEPCAQRVFRS